MPPTVLFDTACFGTASTDFCDRDSVGRALELLKNQCIFHLDTAVREATAAPGRAEALLGEVGDLVCQFTISTKVLTGVDPNGDLTIEAVERSMTESLKRLKVAQVNVLYAHCADPSTSIYDQIKAFNIQMMQGRCKEYGLSNHTLEQVEAFMQFCDASGLRKPSVYQGEYNIITRGMEAKLLPLLRQHGARFVASRTLAAGFLTEDSSGDDKAEGTRMSIDSDPSETSQGPYDSTELHDAFQEFQSALRKHKISTTEVALRWLCHHSALDQNDGLILGASDLRQIETNVGISKQGPLASDILRLVDKLWARLEKSRGTIL